MAAIINGNRLTLSGLVGDYPYEDSFNSSDVVMALATLDDQDVEVHLNSPGGIASDGAAIHAVLSARRGITNIVIEGIAASAASLIAMAGDTVTMSAGAVMMIHDPSGLTWGTSADHSRTIDGLEALANAYAQVYAAKSGKTVEQCRAIMVAETWYDPQQAVDAGFADQTIAGKAMPVAAFDYRIFAHAPERLVALAKAKNWQEPTIEQTTSTKSRKEPVMTGKPNLDAHVAATVRIKAIMQAPEAGGRNELAEHLAFNTTMEADAALAIMKVAPVAADAAVMSDADRLEARRLNGEGLNSNFQPTARTSTLVDTMKRRHGVQ